MAADTDTTPMFQIQRIYLKDLSLEQPNSPQILLDKASRRSTSISAWVPRRSATASTK